MSVSVLIVEDENAEAEGLSTLIKSWGFVPSIAKDGIAGLLLARQLRPHIILTGIDMPGLDGFELIERIRNEKIASRVVVVSAYADPQSVVKAVKLGADEFLSKPVDFEALLLTLQRLSPVDAQGSTNGFDIQVGMTVDEVERKLVIATLEHVQNNKTRAAEILGISLKTLHNKLNEYKAGGFLL